MSTESAPLRKIVARNTGEGDFVHQSQPMHRTFKHVSDLYAGEGSWARRDKLVRNFDELIGDIEAEKSIRFDIAVRPDQVTAVVDETDGEFALRVNSGDFAGTNFIPSEHVLSQLGSPGMQGYGSTVLNHLIAGDEEELNLAVQLVNKSLKNWATERGDKTNIVRVRIPDASTNQLPTVRAILTDRFARIDHDFLVEVVAEAIPEGIATHIRWEEGDTLRFNALIPDFLRQDEDSEFGAMLACRNSEIGTGRITTQPSLFRAICMNGCIWGRHQGKAMNKVHKGNVNLVQLKADILQNLQAQIPLVEVGYQRMQLMRSLQFDAAPEQMITWFANNRVVTVSKAQARTLMEAFTIEPQPTAYGFINAITRAAQAFGNSVQEEWEYAAGDYLNAWSNNQNGQKKWETTVAAAHSYDKATVDNLLLISA